MHKKKQLTCNVSQLLSRIIVSSKILLLLLKFILSNSNTMSTFKFEALQVPAFAYVALSDYYHLVLFDKYHRLMHLLF